MATTNNSNFVLPLRVVTASEFQTILDDEKRRVSASSQPYKTDLCILYTDRVILCLKTEGKEGGLDYQKVRKVYEMAADGETLLKMKATGGRSSIHLANKLLREALIQLLPGLARSIKDNHEKLSKRAIANKVGPYFGRWFYLNATLVRTLLVDGTTTITPQMIQESERYQRHLQGLLSKDVTAGQQPESADYDRSFGASLHNTGGVPSHAIMPAAPYQQHSLGAAAATNLSLHDYNNQGAFGLSLHNNRSAYGSIMSPGAASQQLAAVASPSTAAFNVAHSRTALVSRIVQMVVESPHSFSQATANVLSSDYNTAVTGIQHLVAPFVHSALFASQFVHDPEFQTHLRGQLQMHVQMFTAGARAARGGDDTTHNNGNGAGGVVQEGVGVLHQVLLNTSEIKDMVELALTNNNNSSNASQGPRAAPQNVYHFQPGAFAPGVAVSFGAASAMNPPLLTHNNNNNNVAAAPTSVTNSATATAASPAMAPTHHTPAGASSVALESPSAAASRADTNPTPDNVAAASPAVSGDPITSTAASHQDSYDSEF